MAIAIRAEHVSKEYRLGIINHGMLFKDLKSWWAKRRGKEDPYSKIGTHHFDDQPDRFWALKDVSFEIEQGDRVGIVGRNGAGKSTLLKILSRVTEPTEGRVAIKGRVASLLEVGTGFHPELTGRDNIYLSGAIQGMKRREIDRRMDEIIAFSELEKFIDTPVKRYSSGMYVRLGFAVAAHLENEILLADEVLAVGDQEFQKKCLGKMEDVSKNEGRTVLFVSHAINSVSALCRSGIMLDNGECKAKGEISKIVELYSKSSQNKEVSIGHQSGNKSSNQIEIMSITVSPESNNMQSGIITGKIKFRLYTPLNQLWFGINLNTSDGKLLCCYNSNSSGTFYNLKVGEYSIDYVLHHCLLPGIYLLSMGAAVAIKTLLWIENIMIVNIPQLAKPKESIVRHGLLDLKSDWNLEIEHQ